jgi:hypothetical protein
VCLGVALPSGTETRTVQLPARERVETQEFAASVALDNLRRRIVSGR